MSPRAIPPALIRDAVLDAVGEIYCHPDAGVLELIKKSREKESDPLARDILDSILENAAIGHRDRFPVCQDTGLLVVFAELGNEAYVTGATLRETIGKAAAEAWAKHYLRDSIATDPLRGKAVGAHPDKADSTPDSLPVILHLEQVPGSDLLLRFALKGGGAENCSAMKMFDPTADLSEIEDFVTRTVVSAGGKPCPPVIVGVGIGGDFEYCAVLAKKALLLNAGLEGEAFAYPELAQRILERINAEGKGAQGLGGNTTALEVRILATPCHIASLPVAVNVECHSHRATSRRI